MYILDLPPGPQDAIVANEGLLVGIPDPKNVYNHPGGDWHPGWGVDLINTLL